jgi:hydroxyethylthiazole kinase
MKTEPAANQRPEAAVETDMPRTRSDIMSAASIWRTLAGVRSQAPLIHNITNLVVTNSTANALLALGASPAMVEGADEVEEFARIAAALVINLGTMSADRAAAIRLAVAAAVSAGRPWVLDPVAVGAIGYRTRLARDLLDHRPTVIRANASEILALAGEGGGGKGVDSRSGPESALAAASDLARRTSAVVTVTGAVDYVTDSKRTVAVANGNPMMTRVTGLGCTATALVGACVAIESDPLTAAAHAMAIMGVAGEIAAERARGPGSLQVELLDALYRLDEATLVQRARIGPLG